ncbi:unnamed protein product [Lepeophtheirus salmonis]|uniref:(salmon louse) hypothetical protein n=1 Tax=Lepeophtheirus salmonis TaxID=72036 RepID=A0A7R8HB41_LEPSM|nr:unnamed protein product [Lepeophtheirus salmonis]CAF2975596.1 unnamed protein product [Lepeophtheirus salmonis]
MPHVSFEFIYQYLLKGVWPPTVLTKGGKPNFQRHEDPMYKKENYDETGEKVEVLSRVLFTKAEQKRVIRFVHKGLRNSIESQSMSGHRGKVNNKWARQNVPVPKAAMEQIGIDLASLPECAGYRYFILAIDYFSKRTEGEPLKDKNGDENCLFRTYFTQAHSGTDVPMKAELV